MSRSEKDPTVSRAFRLRRSIVAGLTVLGVGLAVVQAVAQEVVDSAQDEEIMAQGEAVGDATEDHVTHYPIKSAASA